MQYNKVTNYIKASVARIMQEQPGGFLPHKDDPRDRAAEELGLFFEKLVDTNLFDGFLHNQNPWNTCVFFSRTQGASHQNGIQLSARWHVIVAYRNGWISRDGFSTLEAGNKVGNKFGYLPEYLLPSDTSKFRRFKDYVTISDDEFVRLSKVAEKFKVPEYRRVYTDSLAYQTLETGHVIFSAYKWTSNNNNPARYNYILPFTGYFVGGHAIELSGNNGDLKMNPQTYGINFGKDGVVWSRKFSDYGMYIEDMLPLESRLEAFYQQYEGKMVKWEGDPACYVIQNGLKHHVRGDDNMVTFSHLFKKVGLTHVMKDLLDNTMEGDPYPFYTNSDK